MLLVWKFFFNMSHSAGLPVINSLNFCLSYRILISFSVFEKYFCCIWNSHWQYFFLLFKHFLLVFIASDIKWTTILFSQVLLKNNWYISLSKFKAYSLMVWFTYIVKWLPQLVQLTFIFSCKYNKKNNFLLMRIFQFILLTTFLFSNKYFYLFDSSGS